MADEKIVVKVEMDTAKVAAGLNDVTTQMAKLKVEQKALDQQIKNTGDETGELTRQFAQNAETMKLLQAEQKALTGQLQASSDSTLTLTGSFRELDAQCRALENEYKSLTAAQRESAAGKEMKAALIETKEKLKEFDAELGNHQRNVGNYPKAWADAVPAFSKVEGLMKGMGTSLADVGSKGMSAFKNIGQSAKAFGKTMITPPVGIIVAILSAIMLVVNKVVEAFKKNDDAMTALQRAFAAFEPIAEAVRKVFDALAGVIAKVVEAAANMASTLIGVLVPGYKGAANAAQELVNAQDKLEDDERQYTVNSAERQKKIAKLREQAASTKDYDERRKALKSAMAWEHAELQEKMKLAKENYRLLQEKARQEKDTSDEMKNALAQARAAMINTETEYWKGVRKMQKELNSVDAAEQAEAKQKAAQAKAEARQRAQEAKQQAAERRRQAREKQQAEREYQDWMIKTRKETEDALLSIEQDQTQKQLIQIKLQGEREVEELQVKMDRLRKTDVAAREALQKLIDAKEKETQQKMTAFSVQSAEQRAAKVRAIEYAAADLGERDKEVLAQRQVERTKAESERLLNLTKEEKDALYATEEDYQHAVLNAQVAYYNAQETLQKEHYDREQQARANYWEQRKNAAGEDQIALAQIELEMAAEQNETLVNMDAETKARLYGSQEDYEAAMIASNKRLADAQKNATAVMLKDATTKANAIAGAIGALSNLLDQFGEDNKAAAIASKALALGQIAVQTGIALAEGIAQSQSVPFPANIAAIATTVATVLANIATAVSTVKSAKFAQGGIVGGTSYTGDRVPALLNSREMVLNTDQQTQLFKALSAGDNKTLGIDYEMMATAMASTPAPVVVYTELQEFGQKVSTYNEIAAV